MENNLDFLGRWAGRARFLFGASHVVWDLICGNLVLIQEFMDQLEALFLWSLEGREIPESV